MILLGHSEAGHGWGGVIDWWEIHPALNHFPCGDGESRKTPSFA